MTYSCVIIDDELKSRELIKSIIEENFSYITVVGTADSVLSGLKVINSEKPDIIFLDIQLPDGKGFDILEHIIDIECKVIFITAYDEYAIKAFKFSAVDYILKPVNIFELIKSVNKALLSIKEQVNYTALLENIENGSPSKLSVHVKDQILYINVIEIVSITGEGRYSIIKLINKKEYIDSKILSYYEDILDEKYFVRIHKSHIINIRQVISYKKTGNSQVTMSDKSVFNISRYKKELFLDKMGNI